MQSPIGSADNVSLDAIPDQKNIIPKQGASVVQDHHISSCSQVIGSE